MKEESSDLESNSKADRKVQADKNVEDGKAGHRTHIQTFCVKMDNRMVCNNKYKLKMWK